MSRTILTLAALAALGAGTAFAGERTRVTVHNAGHASGNHAVMVQQVHHPHHGDYGYRGGPVMVYPPMHRPPVVVVPYGGYPPVMHPPVCPPPMRPRTSFYYSDPRFSFGFGF